MGYRSRIRIRRGYDNTEHTPYLNPKTTKGTTLLSRVEPQILPGRRDMDLFNLIRAPNPTKVKTGSLPRVGHEVPLLTVTANRVIEIEDLVVATDSSGVPFTIERSLLDFANENPSQQSTGPKNQEAAKRVAPEAGPVEKVASRDPPMVKERCKRAMIGSIQTYPLRSSKGAAAARDPESENTSFASMFRSPESIYQHEWGITNDSMLDAPEACQDLVDHIAPQDIFRRSQLRLRFEQEVKLLKKSVAQVACQDKGIQAKENEIKNLETLLEAEADMRKSAENKSTNLSTELENMCALLSDLQVSNYCLSQQVSSLQEQVTGKEKLKAAFEEFKQYEDNRVEQHCTEMDACLDALSIDLTKNYTHICLQRSQAGIAKGMSEGLKHEVEHGHAKLDLEAIEAYDSKAEAKYIVALHALKNLKVIPEMMLHSGSINSVPVLPNSRFLCTQSHAEKKKKCRVVCRIHGVGSTHHARSDGVSVSMPTVTPQGLAILLADAATQTETSDASPQLLRSSYLLVIHG
nr:hypothetical protein [Tanacetum cinerariifolium]